jgi:hypothetical protein
VMRDRWNAPSAHHRMSHPKNRMSLSTRRSVVALTREPGGTQTWRHCRRSLDRAETQTSHANLGALLRPSADTQRTTSALLVRTLSSIGSHVAATEARRSRRRSKLSIHCEGCQRGRRQSSVSCDTLGPLLPAKPPQWSCSATRYSRWGDRPSVPLSRSLRQRCP